MGNVEQGPVGNVEQRPVGNAEQMGYEDGGDGAAS